MLTKYELSQWPHEELVVICRNLHPKKKVKFSWSKEELVELISLAEESAVLFQIQRWLNRTQLGQSGFSLIGVLVGIALASMLAMLLADLNVVMVRNNLTAQANSDVLAYINSIRANLQSPDLATKMLEGNSLTGSVTVKDPLVTGTILAKAGYQQQAHDLWKVSNVTFENVVSTGTPNVSRLTLVIHIDKSIGTSAARRVVGDVYCFVPSGKVATCSLTAPVAPPVIPPPVVSTKAEDDKKNAQACSEIGGEMSDGKCTFSSTKNDKDEPCNH